ncbi:hypothetical protein DdX_18172 [Ditylenchus destructor]|uniref:Uncharacterized protein n=1 Tax=Ditylenchus destructor TaxID=166010 RepID=A0AAD4QV52_9BILA|nr:hypothetical protein DdX_18172 [Ditylenchus destructor]
MFSYVTCACVGNSERALLDLLQNLRVMGRADAVLVLEEYLAGQIPQPPPPPANSLNSSAAKGKQREQSFEHWVEQIIQIGDGQFAT